MGLISRSSLSFTAPTAVSDALENHAFISDGKAKLWLEEIDRTNAQLKNDGLSLFDTDEEQILPYLLDNIILDDGDWKQE
jgi:hypothetical protein